MGTDRLEDAMSDIPNTRWISTERVGTHIVVRARYVKEFAGSLSRKVLITLIRDDFTGGWNCQIGYDQSIIPLATTDLEEAKAAAIAIWRMG
jgi:hypothetical protein